MKASICRNNSSGVEINQEQVNKFYQQRELSKKSLLPSTSLAFRPQNTQNESLNHDSFKNLFRRKSLRHKLKEDESIFTSFNNSVDYDKPLGQSLLRKSTHRTVYENTLNEENVPKISQHHQNADVFLNEPYNHSSLEQHRKSLYDCGSSESLLNRLKKRSNSVQLESTQIQLSRMKQQKGTVPLSIILKKYQEEVAKMQEENMENQANIIPVGKIQFEKVELKVKENWNKENYQTFNPIANLREGSRKVQKYENKLPQIVEKCIDKWRDLEIQQLKADRLYNSRKDIQKKQFGLCDPPREQPIKNDAKEKQYERVLVQKDERIKDLQRQNNQYKKFIQSILKMKNTLQDLESSSLNSKSHKDKKQNNIQSHQPETNLKDLWRWIKSIPAKKSHQFKKQSLR